MYNKNQILWWKKCSSLRATYFCSSDPASGGSIDWVKGNLSTPYTYVWELRDSGRYGFLLPANQIIDTSEETLNSVVVILQHAKSSLHGNTKRWSTGVQTAKISTKKVNSKSRILAWFQLYNKLRIYTFKTPGPSYFLYKSYCFMRYSNLRVKLEQVHKTFPVILHLYLTELYHKIVKCYYKITYSHESINKHIIFITVIVMSGFCSTSVWSISKQISTGHS